MAGLCGAALISSAAFELAQEDLHTATPTSAAIGLAVGALGFFTADREVARIGGDEEGGRKVDGPRRRGRCFEDEGEHVLRPVRPRIVFGGRRGRL